MDFKPGSECYEGACCAIFQSAIVPVLSILILRCLAKGSFLMKQRLDSAGVLHSKGFGGRVSGFPIPKP